MYSEIDDFSIRRSRYISVFTVVVFVAIISILFVINNKSNNVDVHNDVAAKFMKYKELNFMDTVPVPATPKPTKYPTVSPTHSPTVKPTGKPVFLPTPTPTLLPQFFPTDYPTKSPRLHPTHPPTKHPRLSPTHPPTKTPHGVPTKKPSDFSNSYHPTLTPIFLPTIPPTKSPVYSITPIPTKHPRYPPTHAPHPTAAPTPYSCVYSFVNSIPDLALTLYVESPTQVKSYTTLHGSFKPGMNFKVPVWCLNYYSPIQTYYVYNDTQVSNYFELIANPNSQDSIIPSNIDYLSQVAWILNNIKVGDSTSLTNIIFNGYTFSGCSTSITSSEIQAAFWYLMNYPNCQLTPTSYQCAESIYIDQEGSAGFCNTAYILDAVFQAVPPGTIYSFPFGCVNETTTIIPIVFLPAGDQPFVIGATLSEWHYKCLC